MAYTKEEKAAQDKVYRAANKERIAARKKAYYAANKEKLAAQNKVYYEANKEKVAALNKAWQQANLDKRNAVKARRRHLVRNYNMTPKDKEVMESAYILREILTLATGYEWHVDHIVPVNHPDACGLNSAANLQVVPASWNTAKGNRSMERYVA
tara:strand:+ start:451 stop:912 length:462 start_codon:yes stop_codon:yes gene_type:complete